MVAVRIRNGRNHLQKTSRTVSGHWWVYHKWRTSIVLNIQLVWQINILKHRMLKRKRALW